MDPFGYKTAKRALIAIWQVSYNKYWQSIINLPIALAVEVSVASENQSKASNIKMSYHAAATKPFRCHIKPCEIKIQYFSIRQLKELSLSHQTQIRTVTKQIGETELRNH